ncbi:MAG: DUF503 domain-containing protein [Defluviitaleaceae bacterium]|nr:DUF503 domain-containing protein [Defluviitaleaceae bacterium]
MYIENAKLIFFIPHATSLKDKRRVAKSLIDKAKNKFNASIAEVDTQDAHKTLTIGIAVVSSQASHAQNSLNEIINFMENEAYSLGAELIQGQNFYENLH